MDPAGRELRRGLVFVTRKLLEDGLGLLGELLVGRVATGRDDLAVPEQNKLLYVRPIAKAQTRATELVIVVKTRVLGRQRVADGRLADVLTVLTKEPLNTSLVGGSRRLRVSPATKGAALVESEGMSLSRRAHVGGRVGNSGNVRHDDGKRVPVVVSFF